MRTTLDIDEDILQAAKELARAQNRTAGQVLSELARKGLTKAGKASGLNEEAASYTGDPLVMKNGWYVLPSRGGIVTNELIDKVQEELDLEDARAAGRELPARSDG